MLGISSTLSHLAIQIVHSPPTMLELCFIFQGGLEYEKASPKSNSLIIYIFNFQSNLEMDVLLENF